MLDPRLLTTRAVALHALVILATTAQVSTAAAGQVTADRLPVPSAAQSAGGAGLASDPAAIMDHAHSLAVRGRFREARAEYEKAARVLLAEGILPTEAMWQIAQMHHGESNTRRAAAVLDDLARHAERMGDPVVQARAILEATLLYYSLEMHAEMDRGIQRLDLLRASPYLPPDFADEVDRRLAIG